MRHINKIILLVMFCLTVVILRVVNGPLFDDTAGVSKVHDAYVQPTDGVRRVSLGDLHEETLQALKKLNHKPTISTAAKRQQEIRNEMHIKGAAEKVIAASLPKQAATDGSASAVAKANKSGLNVRTITVAKGDNLTKIVRRVYGCDIKQAHKYVKIVYTANRSVMKSPNDIKAGQKLLIPVSQSSGSSLSKLAKMLPAGTFERTGTTKSVTLTAKRYSTYHVAKGETLSDIAKNVLKDTSRWKEIFELNKNVLKSPDVVPAGVSLRLPTM